MLLSGCTVHPITGRDQMVVMPAVQIAYADADFSLSSRTKRIAASRACVQNCASVDRTVLFAGRVKVLGTRLTIAAREMSPELFARIGRFEIKVDDDLGIVTASSAGGRIVIGAGVADLESRLAGGGVAGRASLEFGLGELEPQDILIAFLIAREMAHVMARHAEEDSGASLAVSAIGLLIPGVHLIARLLVSRVSANALRESWVSEQAREADEIALALLEKCGWSVRSVSLWMERGIEPARLPADGWGEAFLKSSQRVAYLAASSLRYAETGY